MIKLLFRNSFFLFLCFTIFIVEAQKQDRIWLFPDQSGIDFNDLSNPLARSSNITDPCLASFTSIADNQGQLLFYSAGVELSFSSQRVFDKNGNIMENGDSLSGYPWVGQGSMILPMPGDSSKYYLFTGNRTGSLGNNMYYNIIDMSFNSGLGKVVSKNNLLVSDYVNEKMNATKHANGRDWWLVLMSTNTDQLYYKFLITPSGIQGPFVQLIGSSDNRNKAFGQMIFSKDGSMMVAASSNSLIDVFDFDRCSGTLYNFREAGEPIATSPNRYFGCSISQNNRALYVSSIDATYKNVYQFDLTTPNINLSKQTIISYPDTGALYALSMGQHLLGPDNKIYIVKGTNFHGTNWDNYYTHHMDVILDPDQLGFTCNYQSCYLDLGIGKTVIGLPTMVNYNLGPVSGSICDSLTIGIQEPISDQLILYPNPFTKEVSVHSIYALKAELTIRNELGQLIETHSLNGNTTFDLSNLTTGVYFFEIQMNGKMVRKRLVKVE